MTLNPYEPPQGDESRPRVSSLRRAEIRMAFQFAAKATFWLGVMIAVVGQPMTFVPGGEKEWFGLAGTLVLAGLFVPSRRYRVAAVLLCFVLLTQAINGHYRGVEYQRRIRERRAGIRSVKRSSTPDAARDDKESRRRSLANLFDGLIDERTSDKQGTDVE